MLRGSRVNGWAHRRSPPTNSPTIPPINERTPIHTHRGRKCIADSRPPLLKIKKNCSLIVVIFDFNACSVTASIVFHVLSSPRSAGTIFLPFYRRRAAREQYFCRFIVAVQRGNNIFAVLSSPLDAGTISLPFYRHRAARKQYLCRFIVAARRGNNIFAFHRLQHYCEH